jgi:glycosyltransferase involved in cell wall biosynthesis
VTKEEILAEVNNRNLKIALDLSCLFHQPLTGVGYHTLNLVRKILELDKTNEYCAFGSSGQSTPECFSSLAELGARTRGFRIPSRLKHFCWNNLNWPPMEWFTGPADIAHGFFHLLPPTRKAKRIVTIHDLSAFLFKDVNTRKNASLHQTVLTYAAKHADAIVTDSHSTREDVIEKLGAPEDKVHVVYSGIVREEYNVPLDPKAFDQVKEKFNIDGDYFIHLGTLEPRKNIPKLIEAYARLKARLPHCPQLVLAGSKGWMSEPIFEAITRHNLEKVVTVTGYLSRQEILLLLRGAFACVYPSRYEGFGIPVLEAMAARVPVLTSNLSSLPEVIGDTGIQVDPDNLDELEAGMERLITHRDEALAQVDRAYARAGEFSWESSAKALLKVYQTVAPLD